MFFPFENLITLLRFRETQNTSDILVVVVVVFLQAVSATTKLQIGFPAFENLNMANRFGEFRFLLGIHVRLDMGINVTISIRPMTNKFGRQVHLEKLTKMRLIKQLLVTTSLMVSLTSR